MNDFAMTKTKISAIFVFLLLIVTQSNAFWGLSAKTGTKIARLTDNSEVLPDDEIIRLSKLSGEANGPSMVGKELGKLNLPNEALEDTYLRIAIHQNKITRHEAEGMYSRLSGTHGFRTTLRKVTGNNYAGVTGHLNELNIADTASLHGFKVVGIGEKFSDHIKKSPTDIDIILDRSGKRYIIEAKDYSPTTRLPIDKYRADLDTLVVYRDKQRRPVIAVFTISNKPADSRYLKSLQYEAEKRNVELIFGSPLHQIVQIKLLE